jgi:predicted enzyme related to lactoylglutathione lyase
MPTMSSYRHGVPAWTDVSSSDVERTAAFYCGLFDWTMTPDMGPDAGGYRLFLKDTRTVAGIGPNNGAPCAWTTYVKVDDIDAVAASVAPSGGTLAVPPMDLPNGSGRIGFGIDPTGAFFGLFEPGPNHIGAQVVNEPGSVVWNELNTRDIAGAKHFYEQVFGWAMSPMDGSPTGYQVIGVGGRSVAGVFPMDGHIPAEVPAHWLTYFAVEDCQATVDRCAALGGAVTVPPFDTPAGLMAVLHDPTGAVFAVGRMTMIDDPNSWTE